MAKKIYLYEKSEYLKENKKNLWVTKNKMGANFKKYKKRSDYLFWKWIFWCYSIKQFKKEKKHFFEKYYLLDKDHTIKELFKNASSDMLKKDI